MKKLHKKPKGARLICQLSVLGALGVAAGAYAAPETNATFDPSTRGTGDWGGLRTELFNKGYDFSLEYVAEAGSNLRGGYNDDTTARYSDQFAFGLQLDLQKLLGWHDAEFKLAITERSGRNISNDRIGDPRTGTLSSSMEVYGRGTSRNSSTASSTSRPAATVRVKISTASHATSRT
jgi:porin